jgi:hypothetical protein
LAGGESPLAGQREGGSANLSEHKSDSDSESDEVEEGDEEQVGTVTGPSTRWLRF